jgi:hypothetical protein
VEFCKCGSLILNGQCSNKGCTFSSHGKDAVAKASSKKTKSKPKNTVKSTNPRASSKCITYNLYEQNIENK